MIISFRNKSTRAIAYALNTKETRKALPSELHKKARRLLAVLDSAATLNGLSSPGLKLEKLVGDRKGQWSIRINDQYRICFYWRQGEAHEVEIVDYHS